MDFGRKGMPTSHLRPIIDRKANDRIARKLLPIVLSDYDLFFAQLTKWQRDLLAYLLREGHIIAEQNFYRNRTDFYDCMGFLKKWGVVKADSARHKRYSLTPIGKKLAKLLSDADVCRHYYGKFEWIKIG